MALLERLDLADLAYAEASSLPYATLKRLEIARALAARPRLLLLDEPAGGLTHREVAEFGDMMRAVRESFGLTIVLVEHHMGLVMSACDRVAVLHLGLKIAEGTPQEIKEHPGVIAAYLGRAAA
jgi:branched-chain amino acid transport system ATP-binding protein